MSKLSRPSRGIARTAYREYPQKISSNCSTQRKSLYEAPGNTAACAILRASHALGFTEYRAWIIGVLEKRMCGFENIHLNLPHAAEVLYAAKACKVPQIEKRAYYELLSHKGFRSLDDVDREGKLLRKAVPTDSLLRTKDIFLLVKTRELLSDAWLRIINTPPTQSCTMRKRVSDETKPGMTRISEFPCHSQKSTAAAWTRTVQENDWTSQRYRNDPLWGFRCLLDTNWKGVKGWSMCSACERKVKDGWRKSQHDLWDNLGEWLGLVEDAAAEMSEDENDASEDEASEQ
ncbi:hypothetical protein PLICRDRAFT_262352 [Plicaturopsis crispa FD-325 SS-3]|nr:hypothetical protein PLICRDRAFT_262352 [Plicaturopsis crispa FD-325 SS-3]